MKRRNFAFFCCLAAVAVLVFSLGVGRAEPAVLPKKQVIVLDAGHGGIDGGVVGKESGVKESTLNLAVTHFLAKELQNAGFTVLFTRKDEGGLYGDATQGFKKRDMYRRREIIRAAKPCLVLSVHMNSCPSCPTRRGAQTFFWAKNESSRALANALQTALNTLNTRAYAPLAGEYFLLTCSDSPTVIVECGFLSNREDEVLLQTENHQRLLAQTIAKGVVLFLGQSAA